MFRRTTLPIIGLALAALAFGNHPANATSSVGSQLNTYCQDTAGVSPYTGDCSLCHSGTPRSASNADTAVANDWSVACPPVSTPVDADKDGYTADIDCDDGDRNIYPGAPEVCGDHVDQDCDGGDVGCSAGDNDGDGYTENKCDCDDGDPGIHPGATDVCGDNIDQDCVGGDAVCSCPDADGDGFADASCGGFDCNDGAFAINPDAPETCGDGIDQDCDGADLACSEPPAPEPTPLPDPDPTCGADSVTIDRAVFNQRKHLLTVLGTSTTGGGVSLWDAETGDLLAERIPVMSGAWKTAVRGLDRAPAILLAENTAGCTADREISVRKRKSRRSDGDDAPAPAPQPDPEPAPAQHEYGWSDPAGQHGDFVEANGVEGCVDCHSVLRADKGQTGSCFNCHGQEWETPPGTGGSDEDAEGTESGGGETSVGHEFGWTDPEAQHPAFVEDNGTAACESCHSVDPASQGDARSCFNCHGDEWSDSTGSHEEEPGGEPEGSGGGGSTATHEFGWTDPAAQHEDYVETNGVGECGDCHSLSRGSRGQPLSCYNCHGNEWSGD